MENITISVALATFNGAQFITRQLASLLAQTLPACQVVISDDGSQDGTAELCEAFIQAHAPAGWRVIKNAERAGFIGNFCRAMDACSGDYIALCDQDDEWEPEKLERLAAFLLKHPCAGALCTSVRAIDAQGSAVSLPARALAPMQGRVFPPKGGYARVPSIARRAYPLIRKGVAPGCTMLIRRDICREYTRAGVRLLPHDWELAMLASCRGGLYYLREPLVRYRLHGGNVIGLSGGAVQGEGFCEKRLRFQKELLNQAKTAHEIARTRQTAACVALLSARGRALSGDKRACFAVIKHPACHVRLLRARGVLADWLMMFKLL